VPAPDPWTLTRREYAQRPEATTVPRGSLLAGDLTDVNPERLARHTVDELRRLALVLGVPHSGTRATLTPRLVNAAALRRLLAGARHADLMIFKAGYLFDQLVTIGEYAPPNRYAAASALIGWRDRCRRSGRNALAYAKHFSHVRRALRLGRDIPAEVLAEYPELTDPSRTPLFADE
jgi:hypothetical protein